MGRCSAASSVGDTDTNFRASSCSPKRRALLSSKLCLPTLHVGLQGVLDMLRNSRLSTLTRIAQLARGAATSSEGQQWKWLQDRGHVVNPCNSRSVIEACSGNSALQLYHLAPHHMGGSCRRMLQGLACLSLRSSNPKFYELPVAGCIRHMQQACPLRETSCLCKQHTLQTATALAAVHHHSNLFAITGTLWQLHKLMLTCLQSCRSSCRRWSASEELQGREWPLSYTAARKQVPSISRYIEIELFLP